MWKLHFLTLSGGVVYCEEGIMHQHLLAQAFCLYSDSQDRRGIERDRDRQEEHETKTSKREKQTEGNVWEHKYKTRPKG